MQNFPLSIACNWQTRAEAKLPENPLASWLFETGSLTERLRSHSERFDVEVMNEIRQPVEAQQREILGTQAQTLLNREVLLICDGQPMVYAQSWIPEGARVGAQGLDKLGSRPLGEVIFSDKNLTRQAIEVGCFEREHDVARLSRSLKLPDQTLWGRRSVFMLPEENILVCEIFLPRSYPYL